MQISCAAVLSAFTAWGQAAAPLQHSGICDASAAVAVGKHRFLVANDEDNTLRLYDSERSGKALDSFDLSAELNIKGQKKGREVDIEGAAQIGNRIYWIGSHGANSAGEVRPKRRQLFATDISEEKGKVKLTWVGRYTGLLEATAQREAAALNKYRLVERAGHVPESADGLNIEGLAATPQGSLLIGFRNPAGLIIEVTNPEALVSQAGAVAKFGPPVELQLGGLGIRSIEYAPLLKAYVIVAGPSYSAGEFKLYKWSGAADKAAEALAVALPAGLRPEALFAKADGSFQLLSDDGDEKIDGADCKLLKSDGKKSFRSITLAIKP